MSLAVARITPTDPSALFLEQMLVPTILAPSVDLHAVSAMVDQLADRPDALKRAMFAAIQHGPRVQGATDDSYLHVVELLVHRGVPLPQGAAWVAYADEIPAACPRVRAQRMTELVVRLGGCGGLSLRLLASQANRCTYDHGPFLKSLQGATRVGVMEQRG